MDLENLKDILTEVERLYDQYPIGTHVDMGKKEGEVVDATEYQWHDNYFTHGSVAFEAPGFIGVAVKPVGFPYTTGVINRVALVVPDGLKAVPLSTYQVSTMHFGAQYRYSDFDGFISPYPHDARTPEDALRARLRTLDKTSSSNNPIVLRVERAGQRWHYLAVIRNGEYTYINIDDAPVEEIDF